MLNHYKTDSIKPFVDIIKPLDYLNHTPVQSMKFETMLHESIHHLNDLKKRTDNIENRQESNIESDSINREIDKKREPEKETQIERKTNNLAGNDEKISDRKKATNTQETNADNKEINKSLEKTDHKLSDTEAMKDEAILKDAESLLSVLKMLSQHSEKFGEISELTSSLEKFRELILNKSETILPQVKNNNELLADLKKIFSKLKSILAEIGEINKSFVTEYELQDLKAKLSSLNEQIDKFMEYREQPARFADSERYIKKNDVGRMTASENDSNKKEINNQANIKLESGEKLFKNNEDSLSSKNEGSNYGFQFSRKDQSIFRQGSAANNLQKYNNNDKEFQTILQQARIVIRDGKNGSFSIRLYPESLGRVNVNLDLERGILVGKFLVESSEAREALLENITSVKQRLEESGISVGEFQVNVREERPDSKNQNHEMEFSHKAIIDNDSVISNEYEMNASSLHNGEIDFVI